MASGKYATTNPKTLSAEEKRAELKRIGYGDYDIQQILSSEVSSAVSKAAETEGAKVYDDIPFD